MSERVPVVLSLGFTRISLRNEHTRVLQLVARQYEMHRFVYGILKPVAGEDRVLYRTEVLPDRSGLPTLSVLIQHSSRLSPILDAGDQRFASIEHKRVSIEISPGTYRFRLRANPVKAVPHDKPGVRGKRRGLSSDDERKSWLFERFADHGMNIQRLECVPEPFVEFSKNGSRGRGKIAIAGVMYNGIVRIQNPERTAVILENGVGRARAFGYGLVSLASLR